MANEFTARNGIIAKNNSVITGSLIVTQGITGSLFGTSSGAISSSFAATASLAPLYLPLAGGQLAGNLTAPGRSFTFQDLILTSGTTQGKISSDSGAPGKPIGMYPNINVESTRFYGNGNVGLQNGGTYTDTGFRLQVSASTSVSGALQIIGTSVITGSLSVSGGVTGSLLGTASFATSASQAQTASYVLNAVSASFSTLAQTSNTASYVVTAQTASYVLQAVSASLATLSQTANTASYIVTAQTASFVTTAQTASYVLNAISSSFATSASYALSSSFAISSSLAQTASFVTLAQTASYILNAVSASRSISSANADTASFVTLAQTASYVQNAISASYIVTAQTASYVLNAVSSSFATSASYALKAVSASIATKAAASDTASKADQVKVIDNVNSLLYFPLIASSSAGYQQVTTVSGISYDADNAILVGTFQGNLEGTAGNAFSALTSSYVNTLNQNVLISGSLTVGSGSIGPNENTLTLGARDAASEGGQIGFNAPGGTYTSASFIDNWQNKARILKGNNTTSTGLIAQWDIHTTQMQLPGYTNASSFPGTATANLAVDSGGNVITVSTSGGSVFPYTGNAVITGSLTATTGFIAPNTNGAMYLRGGDDVELWDINVSNHLGIYGQQDQAVASIKLGSGGGIISGRSGSIGIGTTTPTSGTLQINGNVFATSFTGSLQGTASNAVTASYVLNAVSSSFARSSSFATSASYASVKLANVLATGNTTNNQAITSNNASSSITLNDFDASLARGNSSISISDTEVAIIEGNTGYASIYLQNGNIDVYTYGTFTANGDEVITSASLNTALAAKQNTLTLTTTGTSGAATLVSGTLNIPQYSGGGGAAFPYTGDASISGSLTVTGSASTQVPLQILSGSTSLLYVSSSGRVGISNSAPTSRLQLNFNQNSTAQNDNNGILLANSTAATVGLQSISPGLVWQGNGWKTTATAGSQDVRFRADVLPVQGTTNPSPTWRLAASVNSGAYTNYLTISTVQALGANGLVTVAGELVANGQFSIPASVQSSFNLPASAFYQYKTTNAGGSVNSVVVIGNGSGVSSAGNLSINVDPTNQISLSVGNGSAAIARAAIQVSGSNNTPGSEAGDLLFLTQTGGTAMSEKMRITGAGNVNILSGSTSLLYVSSSGNVSIGSTNNTYKLDVNGTTRVVGALTLDSHLTQTSAGLVVNVQQLLAVGANTTAQQSYRMTNAGGTVTPKINTGAFSGTGANRLHYDETNQLTFGVFSDNARDVTRAAIQVSGSNNASGSEAGDLLFLTQTGGTAASEKMRIFGGGNVAIGTSTNSGYKLDVSGTARVSSIEAGSGISMAGNSSGLRFALGNPTVYRTTNAGAALTPVLLISPNNGGNGSINSGGLGWALDDNDATGLSFLAGNGTNHIARAGITITNLTNTAGSESGDMIFLTQTGGTAMTEKMRITGAGGITYTATNTAAGTTGDQTINKPSGTVNIAAAGTAVTVTNSLVTANSIVFATIRTNDSTAVIKNVVPTAGSFTINLNAATTAETSIGFFVIN